ncbi:hypothetical protein [Arenibacter certesii]|uniref:Uncharacterized protein n=1 Tax=Arenibacter certesii TaxID=228955 RepID=A0A918IVA8_9FLAO|nr:hypothetical protein [Arenibacter certesii]GGW33628.1 hypothetical protein GCM10007383_18390 [Arenibacter certesii]
MKAILTLIFILFISISTHAQSEIEEGEINTLLMKVEINYNAEVIEDNSNEVVRVYKFKNSRIKKALAFATKMNNPKLA